MQLDAITAQALRNATVSGCHLTLVDQLSRPDYIRVNKAIEMMGGKWNRKARCHVFDAPAEEVVADPRGYGGDAMSYELDEPNMSASTVGIIVGPVFLILLMSFVFGPDVFAAVATAVAAAALLVAEGAGEKRLGLALFIATLWATAIVITIHAVEVLT